MLVLLPPSETKAAGGDGEPMDLDALPFPELFTVRKRLVDTLVSLAADVPASLAALGLSPRQAGAVAGNAALWESATMPALARYTGVLYDALDIASMTGPERAGATGRLAVASALFGLLRGGDPIPAYRLSARSRLPGTGPLPKLWRPVLAPLLSTIDKLVVDLRSGAYAALAPAPGAVGVRVVTPTGAAVSHHNKAHKGRLARALALAEPEPRTVRDLLSAAAAAGLDLHPAAGGSLELVVRR